MTEALRFAVVLVAVAVAGCTRGSSPKPAASGVRTLPAGGGPARVAFSPDGKTLAVGSGESVRLWDRSTGEERRTLSGHRRPVHGVAYSPDGRLLASAAGDFRDGKRAGEVKVWDAASGEPKHTLAWWQDADVNAVAFSPRGEWVAAGGLKGVRVWNARTGAPEKELPLPAAVLALAFSPDGKTLAAGAFDQWVHLWDARTWQERKVLKGHRSEVRAVAYSPDGNTLATGGVGELRLWDAATGEFRGAVECESTVRSVSFAPDGKTLATGCGDPVADGAGELRLWDAAQRTPKGRWAGPGGAAVSVAFSPDGAALAVGWYSGAVELRDPNQ